MGHVVYGRGKPATVRRLPQTVPEYTEDAQGQAPGPARQPDNQLSRENAIAIRVRETSQGRGMGGDQHRRPDKRHIPAADFVLAVSSVSALLHPSLRPVQGQDARVVRECVQTRMAAQPRDTDQFQGFR